MGCSPHLRFMVGPTTADRRFAVAVMEQFGIAWHEPEDVKACITLLGDIFHKRIVAERYRLALKFDMRTGEHHRPG